MGDTAAHPAALAATGIEGFDDILGGGFTPNRLYLIEGDPGSGKTTLALQFLLEGARRGERGLYVTLSETKDELHGVARSHGWSLDALAVCELIPAEDSLLPDAQTRMFHPSEVELSETTKAVLAEVERIKPARVVFDSLSEMRLLAQNPLRYRRQILALKQFFIGRQCTVLLLDDRTSEVTDLQLQSLAHGVVTLEHLAQEYGAERRRLRLVKMRGMDFQGGFHDFSIRRGGLQVFPRLVASEHHAAFEPSQLPSGVAALDALLGGGLDRGSEFEVRLPALADAAGATGGPEEPGVPVAAATARRVLVVDDNTDAADTLALLLRMGGHDVRTAYNGPAALEAARAFRPEVVLLDIGLPGMNGYEVARRLRAQAGLGRAFLVAVTGYGQDDDRRHSREAGFDCHLVKPLDPQELGGLLAGLPPARGVTDGAAGGEASRPAFRTTEPNCGAGL